MSGAVPPVGRPLAFLVLGLLLWVPSASAAPVEVDLEYDGTPVLEGEGTWLATDGFVDLHTGDSVPSFRLEIEADEVIVTTQTWDFRKTDLWIYGDESRSKRDEVTTRHTDASVILEQLRPGSRITLSSDAWSLAADFPRAALHSVQDVWATADPEDTDHREHFNNGAETEGRAWPHTVHLEDQVLAEPDRLQYEVQGDLSMTLYEGDLDVRSADGPGSYTSGETHQMDHDILGDAVETSKRQLLVVTFKGASLIGHWGGYSRIAATEPVVMMNGTLDIASTRGTVAVDRMAMRAHDDPIRAEGLLTLLPKADPERESLPFDPFTEEVAFYDGGRLKADGEAAYVTLASAPVRNPFSNDPDLLVATGTGLGLIGILYAIWRYGPLAFAALYSRLEQGDLLDNPTRAEIYQIVCTNPGISARRVHEHSDASWGTVVHHLSKLEAAGMVAVRANGRAKSYYENHGKWDGYQDQLALLARDKTRLVAEAVLKVPGRDQNQIIRRTELPQSTVSFHLLKLEKAGLVTKERTGQTMAYYPTLSLRSLSERLPSVSVEAKPEPMTGGAA